MQEDTITAIATAIGSAGIGIIRMSGNQAINIADKIFKSLNGKRLADLKDRSIILGYILDNDGNIIDEAVILIMRAPKSYTKEDVVELQCHGSMVALQKVLTRTLEAGARLAERGEFTKRAFLNGRLDLSQAEAVLDIIQAKTEKALEVAENKLFGKVKNDIHELRQQLLGIISHIEAMIDFPEEDIDSIEINKIENDLSDVVNKIDIMLKTSTEGKILQEGIETVIIGKPNVGKSSLLNLLSKSNKAIVTDIPGTTRDIIEEYININGIPLKIIDTAGIHNSNDKIELLGITKARECANQAAFILALFDGSRELDNEDEEIFKLIKNRNMVILITKSDLPQKMNVDLLKQYFQTDDIIKISTKTQEGIEKLKQGITKIIGDISNDLNFVKNARELSILKKIKRHIEEAKYTIKINSEIDLISIDIRSALYELDVLTGKSINEDIINEIFSKFCIGK